METASRRWVCHTLRLLGVLALVQLPAACGSRPDTPIVKATGPARVEGPLSLTPIRFSTTEHDFRPTIIDAEEGRLRVAERHGNPQGRQIEVRFVRFASTAARPGSPIVYLAGGPGGSGTRSASGDRFPLFQRLRKMADVIAYDQRGTWGTDPYMVCPGSWSYPLDRPWEEETLRSAVTPFLEECAEHWAGRADLSAYNTIESAEDLESLRRALGADRLTLWGISYGTHLALAYIRAYPDRVDRAILAGVEGPDHTWKLPERGDAVLRRVDEAIRADPRARAAAPDFLPSLEDLLGRLERNPVTVKVEHPKTRQPMTVVVGAGDLRRAIFSALGEREDIEQLLERGLPVLRGDFRNLALFALQNRANNRALVMSLSMDCASGVSPERRTAIRRQEETSLLGNPNMWLDAACSAWPVEDLGDAFRSPVEASVPVLFISGTLDGRTPPENAEEVLRRFPNGRHLVIEGGSHDDDLFLSSAEIVESMMAFLRGERPRERIVLAPIRFRLP
ncbi:MAG TPA: alpha/beta hydrolase [Thermoanaerobaculia bacterium]|nr:alpha/beta hydrolase [Thermoanaerobaculia bacterium]